MSKMGAYKALFCLHLNRKDFSRICCRGRFLTFHPKVAPKPESNTKKADFFTRICKKRCVVGQRRMDYNHPPAARHRIMPMATL